VRDGETGLVADVGDTDRLAEHVLALAADPARAKAMGRAGRLWVQDRFSLEAMLQGTLELYS
jgi:glycosyltransferase involved in cell wall biosynthesis